MPNQRCETQVTVYREQNALKEMCSERKDYIQENITRILVYDQKRCARLWHLEMVLLGRPLQLSWFRKLTYSCSGLRVNISSTEDIFDRVLSFLGRLEGECYEGDEGE